MKTSTTALTAALIVSAGVCSWTTLASALGACGPNRHRNAAGYCVWGGQRQAWCVRHTGQVAGSGGSGTRWCRG